MSWTRLSTATSTKQLIYHYIIVEDGKAALAIETAIKAGA